MEVKPGFKQTEVGVIPEEWDVSRLCEIATIATGNTPPTRDAINYGNEYLFVSPVDMGNNKYVTNTEKKLSRRGFAISRRFPKHSILFVCIGSTIGKCGIAPVELTSNQQINAVFPSPRFSVDYLFYAVCAAAPRIKAQAGEQAVPIVNKTQFSENVFALPPLPEQCAIAEALSDVDGLLGGLERLIAKKRDLKQAAMQQLLTGLTRLPGFHGEWEVKRLGDVTDSDPENLGSDTRPDFTFNYISLEDVDQGKLRGFAEQVFRTSPSRARRKLRDKDVLVSTVRPNLKSHLLFQGTGHAWVCSTGFCVVRCREKQTHPGYVFFHMFGHLLTCQIKALLTGSNYPAINSSDVRALEIPVPDFAEQTAIAEVLTDMDAELAALERRREKTFALKQAMMQELLTGKTRLV